MKKAKLCTIIVGILLLMGMVSPVSVLGARQYVILFGKGTLTTAGGDEYMIQSNTYLEIAGVNPSEIWGTDGRVQLIQAGFPRVNDQGEYLFRVSGWQYDGVNRLLLIKAVASNGFTLKLSGEASRNPRNGKIQGTLSGSVRNGDIEIAQISALSFDMVMKGLDKQ